jgi:hypothetical protein
MVLELASGRHHEFEDGVRDLFETMSRSATGSRHSDRCARSGGNRDMRRHFPDIQYISRVTAALNIAVVALVVTGVAGDCRS